MNKKETWAKLESLGFKVNKKCGQAEFGNVRLWCNFYSKPARRLRNNLGIVRLAVVPVFVEEKNVRCVVPGHLAYEFKECKRLSVSLPGVEVMASGSSSWAFVDGVCIRR